MPRALGLARVPGTSTGGGSTGEPGLAFADYAELAAYSAVALTKGNAAEVLSPESYWLFDPGSTLTPDGQTIIAATGGGNWVRMGMGGIPKYQDQDAWFIDAATGDDENDGLTALTAVATAAEIFIRTGGQFLNGNTFITYAAGTNTENVNWTLMSNGPNRTGFVIVIGTRTTIASGTATAAQNIESPLGTLALQDGQITDSALASTWTAAGGIGKLLTFTNSGSSYDTWGLVDLGSKTMRFGSQPNMQYWAGEGNLTVGDPWTISTLTTLTGYHVIAPQGGAWLNFVDLNFETLPSTMHQIGIFGGISWFFTCRMIGIDADCAAEIYLASCYVYRLHAYSAFVTMLSCAIPSVVQVYPTAQISLYKSWSQGGGINTQVGGGVYYVQNWAAVYNASTGVVIADYGKVYSDSTATLWGRNCTAAGAISPGGQLHYGVLSFTTDTWTIAGVTGITAAGSFPYTDTSNGAMAVLAIPSTRHTTTIGRKALVYATIENASSTGTWDAAVSGVTYAWTQAASGVGGTWTISGQKGASGSAGGPITIATGAGGVAGTQLGGALNLDTGSPVGGTSAKVVFKAGSTGAYGYIDINSGYYTFGTEAGGTSGMLFASGNAIIFSASGVVTLSATTAATLNSTSSTATLGAVTTALVSSTTGVVSLASGTSSGTPTFNFLGLASAVVAQLSGAAAGSPALMFGPGVTGATIGITTPVAAAAVGRNLVVSAGSASVTGARQIGGNIVIQGGNADGASGGHQIGGKAVISSGVGTDASVADGDIQFYIGGTGGLLAGYIASAAAGASAQWHFGDDADTTNTNVRINGLTTAGAGSAGNFLSVNVNGTLMKIQLYAA